MSRVRKFTRRFFVFANVTLVVLFLLSCLSPYTDPRKWWIIAFLGLGFPLLLFLVVLFLAGWLIILKPKRALISAFALLLAYNNIAMFFAFHAPGAFDYKKDPKTLRVVSWNVARFIELKRNTGNKGSQTRLKMFDLIKQQDADVLCFQEFYTATDSIYYDNITPIKELGYPYYFFTFDDDGDNQYYSSIIFSRYPLIDSGRVRYPRPSLPEVLMYADIKLGNDTVRIFTTHLQSLQFYRSDYERIKQISSGQDSLIANSKTVLGKIKKGFSRRAIQADVADDVMSISPHPHLMCADLNDVPNSYSYQTIKGNMQDAFLKKGFGIGRTFASLSPTLRIDYIFADKNFHIKQFNRISKRLSDHYMLVADLELKK